MTSQFLVAVVNHASQSTLFAAGIAFLAFTMRRNRVTVATVRSWLWTFAFALLVGAALAALAGTGASRY